MNTKPLPIIITLAAAFISCVISIIEHVDFSVFVMRLLITVAIFLVLGTIVKLVLDYSFKTLEEPVPIDKDTPDMEKNGSEDDSQEETPADITLDSNEE
ncbi:MAG: hypothetical protein K5773_02775 [Pseudobutyrivibrio sp.]|nr:hypothetical protein [Pseudobutyrivibrio sp.]